MGALQDLQEAVAGAAETVGPSVVGLGRGFRYASGVVVGQDRVLTNAHNVRGEDGMVTLADGTSVSGRLVGMDVDGDVAVIEAPTGDAPPVRWEPAGQAAPLGTAVLALAHPG